MFHSARLKLTSWYLLIIMLISFSFTAVIYRVLSYEIERFAKIQRFRIESNRIGGELFLHTYPPPATPLLDPDLIAETKHRLFVILLTVNGVIFLASGALGYLLAGRTLEPIKIMVDEQNRFITDASHELRTPLTALKSSLEVHLRDKDLTLKDARILIKDSITDVNKLQSLSDGLLQLTQYQKSNGNIIFTKISLLELINEVIRKATPVAKKKNITIITKIKDYEIEGYKHGLYDILMILLDNAIKYSPNNKDVIISTGKSHGQVNISIKDQGIGIDQKDISYIFDRFYRADRAKSKTTVSGYGLGLSIAKKIVSIHNGSISVESELKKGSKFTVKLPVKHHK